MRNQDLADVAAHVIKHSETPQRDAMHGGAIMDSYVQFAGWALPRLIISGWIGNDHKPVPGGPACNRRTP